MPRLEAEFRSKLVATMKKQGAMVYPLLPQIPTGDGKPVYGAPTGWPDLLVISRIWSGLIETKGHDTRHSPLQLKTLEDLGIRWMLHVVTVRDISSHELQVTWHGTLSIQDWRCSDVELLQLLRATCKSGPETDPSVQAG